MPKIRDIKKLSDDYNSFEKNKNQKRKEDFLSSKDATDKSVKKNKKAKRHENV